MKRSHGSCPVQPRCMLSRQANPAGTGWGDPAEARASVNPVAKSDENLGEARAQWVDHCASCHGIRLAITDSSWGFRMASSISV